MGCCPLRPGTRSGGGRRGFSLKMGVMRGPRGSAEKAPGPEQATGQSRCRPGPEGRRHPIRHPRKMVCSGHWPGVSSSGVGLGPRTLSPPPQSGRACEASSPPGAAPPSWEGRLGRGSGAPGAARWA